MIQPGTPQPTKPVCSESGKAYIRALCVHGSTIIKPLDCRECDTCHNHWRTAIRTRIRQGIKERPGRYYFGTFTLCPHTRWRNNVCRHCGVKAFDAYRPTITGLMFAWTGLRRALSRRGGFRFFRVVELHQSGQAHLHFVTDKVLPLVSKARHNESVLSYWRRQTPAAREFLKLARSFGFGLIADFQQAYKDGRGMPKYLSKYLSKGTREIYHPSGRRVRVAESSRDWYVNPHRDTWENGSCQYVVVKKANTADVRCQDCAQERATTPQATWAENNARKWLSKVNPIPFRLFLGDLQTLNGQITHLRNTRCELQRRYDHAADSWIPFDEETLHQIRRIIDEQSHEIEVLKFEREQLLDQFGIGGYHGPISLLEELICPHDRTGNSLLGRYRLTRPG